MASLESPIPTRWRRIWSGRIFPLREWKSIRSRLRAFLPKLIVVSSLRWFQNHFNAIKDARTPFDIPVLEEDGVYISGSSLAISILESQENFARNNEFFSLEELKKRFPKVKVAWQTMESALNKFLFTQEKVMNRCWTLHPVQDKLDVDMDKQTLRFHKITKRANKARTLADEELKPLLLHTMHLDYSQR